MNPETSIETVLAYLKNAFPNGKFSHKPDFDSRAEDFDVYHAGTVYRLRASHEFLNDLTEPEIQEKLTGWRIAQHMRDSGDRVVDLSREGVLTAMPRKPAL